jgi:glycosyltransferase involved in cell wall biosynthesis
MTTDMPLVTVLLNNYNYGPFLAQAIDSVLAQPYSNLEVVVVDDGSTDDSREITSSYGDRLIPVFKENGGQASAFNAGFAVSHGEWVLLLDSDDLFLPRKVDALVSYAKTFPLAGVIGHDYDYCDKWGDAIHFPSPKVGLTRLVDDTSNARRGKFSACLPPTSALALRRDIATQIFPMPEDITICADNFIRTLVLALTPVLLISECLSMQRLHSKNSFTTLIRTQESTLAECLAAARVAYRMKERFPFLDKIAWKAYGAVAYRLMASRAKNAKEVRKTVRLKYRLLDGSLPSFYYVGGGFVATLLRDFIDARSIRQGSL